MKFINWSKIKNPLIQQGSHKIAYCDPSIHFHDNVFRVFFSKVELLTSQEIIIQLAVTESTDLLNWSSPQILSNKNHPMTNPGNIIRYKKDWVMTCNNYHLEKNQLNSDEMVLPWITRSTDLINWSKPEVMLLKSPNLEANFMGNCSSPCLVKDISDPEKWWCFFNHGGLSINHNHNSPYRNRIKDSRYTELYSLNLSYSYDLVEWNYWNTVNGQENYCVMTDQENYILVDSPSNGIGMKMSSDLIHWHQIGLYTLGQRQWEWANGRITSAHIINLKNYDKVGKYLMVFNGCTQEGLALNVFHGQASVGLAWSDDLSNWYWPQ